METRFHSLNAFKDLEAYLVCQRWPFRQEGPVFVRRRFF